MSDKPPDWRDLDDPTKVQDLGVKLLREWADSDEPWPLYPESAFLMSYGAGVVANPGVDLVVEKDGAVERTRLVIVPDCDADQAE